MRILLNALKYISNHQHLGLIIFVVSFSQVRGVVYKNNFSVIHGPFFILFGSENNYFDTNIAYDKDWAFTR